MCFRTTQLRRLVSIIGAIVISSISHQTWAQKADRPSAADGSGNNLREMRPAELAAKVSPQVVQINTGSGVGSGFFVSKDLVVTCFHVIRGCRTIRLKSAKWEGSATTVVAWDADADIAVLRVLPRSPFVGLNVSKGPYQIGSHVLVVSSPLGLQGTVSDGLLSAIREQANGVLQISAPISPGSSGGPLVDSYGNVIGVVSSTLTALTDGRTYGQNLNFAVPSTAIYRLMSRPKNTTLDDFATQTTSEEEERWKKLESSLPAIGETLKAELGPTVGPAFAIAIQKAISAKDAGGLEELLKRRETLKQDRSRLVDIALPLIKVGGQGELLSYELLKSWDELVIHPGNETQSQFLSSFNKVYAYVRDADERAGRPPFPERFAGFPFKGQASDVLSYCYPGYAFEGTPGFATVDCPRVPVSPPFATGKASLTFLNGSLVAVELTAKSYQEAVQSVTTKYGAPEFLILTQGNWNNTPRKPSFGPNTSYNWHLKGGRIRIGRTDGRPFIYFIHSDSDIAVSNSY